MGLEEKSYKAHSNIYQAAEFEKELDLYRHWFSRKTTDLWRHRRMLSVLDPFLKTDNNARWLTVGDGRFGTSAIYINAGGGRALATDIDTRLLELAKQNEMLNEIAFANAEKLPFDNDQFDYSYCKLSYHHFPRPSLALYEMLRVSRRAVILTEPHDYAPPPVTRAILQKVKHLLKKLTGASIPHHDTGNFEEAGNYVYTVSVRELEKAAQALGLPCLAYKLFHDEYFQGVEEEPFSENAPLYKKIRTKIGYNSIQAALGLNNPNNIQAIIFKTIPPPQLLSLLKRENYTITKFPINPYI